MLEHNDTSRESEIDLSIPVITIDGPAGSGKGTISQRVASHLNLHILDSGALYRLVGLAALRKKIAFSDEKAISDLAQNLDVVFKTNQENEVIIILEGDDVSQTIRTEEVGSAASQVAAISSVRTALLDRQRRFQLAPGLVADGRDMGTVVFPQAKVKIFLTASAEIRAERRFKQLKQQGIDANLRGLIRDIEIRDSRDTNRKDAPLVPAADATIIDTDHLSIDEVVKNVLTEVKKTHSDVF